MVKGETMAVRFGVFVPQGWRMDLVEIADPVEQFEAMTAVAKAADADPAWDSIWVYDHFHTVPEPLLETTFECWTITATLARDTSRVSIGQMVGCNGYRNPALYAKIASTVDVASHGRLYAGIGAGWYEHEWRAYGYGFPETPERMRMFREAVEIIHKMWTEDYPTFEGRHYTIDGPINEPKGVQQAAPSALDRRRRREGHAEAGRAVRRRLQLRRRRSRGHPPEARGAQAPLRRARPRLRRDHQVNPDLLLLLEDESDRDRATAATREALSLTVEEFERRLLGRHVGGDRGAAAPGGRRRDRLRDPLHATPRLRPRPAPAIRPGDHSAVCIGRMTCHSEARRRLCHSEPAGEESRVPRLTTTDEIPRASSSE